MPTYAYACTECDHNFEAQQSFSDDALTQCPQCTGRLRKLFNSVGIVFKGSGFYRTDSRASGDGAKAKDAAASSGGDGAATATASDTAPATAGASSSSSGSGTSSPSHSGGSSGSSGSSGGSTSAA